MPEGPEIRRAADAVRAAVGGHKAQRIWFGLTRLQRWQKPLTGATVREVESRGKALLVRFDNGLNIYSHNQLYGRWFCCTAGDKPETRRQLRLEIRTAKRSALLYSASSMEVLRDSEIGRHPYLSRLGPDLLASGTMPAQIAARLDEPGFRRRRLGGLLIDQSFVAGIGNYLRCEILFSAGLLPEVRPTDLGPAQRLALVREMLRLSRQSYRTGGVTNDEGDAERLMASGASFEAARFRVFRRAGEPCRVCGKEIRRARRGGQACYWCPRCQAGVGGNGAG